MTSEILIEKDLEHLQKHNCRTKADLKFLQLVYGISNEAMSEILGIKKSSFSTLKNSGSFSAMFTNEKLHKIVEAIRIANSWSDAIEREIDNNGYLLIYTNKSWDSRIGIAKEFTSIYKFDMAVHAMLRKSGDLLRSHCLISTLETSRNHRVPESEVAATLKHVSDDNLELGSFE